MAQAVKQQRITIGVIGLCLLFGVLYLPSLTSYLASYIRSSRRMTHVSFDRLRILIGDAVCNGAPIRKTFWFTNMGDRPITIEKARSSCELSGTGTHFSAVFWHAFALFACAPSDPLRDGGTSEDRRLLLL